MSVVISKSSGLNDDLWNEWAPMIRSFIMDADKESRECFLSKLEEQNFKTTLDLVLYFEY